LPKDCSAKYKVLTSFENALIINPGYGGAFEIQKAFKLKTGFDRKEAHIRTDMPDA